MGGESTRCVSRTRSPRARVDPRTSRAVPGAHSRVWAVACRLGFLANAVRFRGSTSRFRAAVADRALSSQPAPPSPRSLYVRGIILGYKRYVDGPTAEPLPRVARRARRERRKTRRVFRARRAPRRRPGRPTRDSKLGNDGVARCVRRTARRASDTRARSCRRDAAFPRSFDRARPAWVGVSSKDARRRDGSSRGGPSAISFRARADTHLHDPRAFPTPQRPHEPDEPHVSDQAGERERV